MKKFLFFLFLFVASFSITNVSAASIKNDNINIYHLSDKYSHLEMPSSFKEEEKIEIVGATGNIRYRIIEGNYISVSNDGVVRMQPTVWWCSSSGLCSSWAPEDTTGYTKREDYYEEDAKIEVSVGSEKFIVNVHAKLYEKYYAEKKMKDYIDENITSSMTDMEKMEKIMEFISMTRYSYNSSSYVGLVAGDGADCWGDTSAILYMCDLAGIKAHARNANRDSGAGSGHRNAAVVLDGKVYIADVMSTTNTPRVTEITPTQNGFSVDGFGKVIQYDGYDEVAYMPKSPYITKVGDLAMYYGIHSETKIKEVHVPSTIESIGMGSFSAASTLEKVVIDPDNPNYKNIGNNVYSKDASILYAYPSGQKEEEFIVPNGVKEIKADAFYGTKSLKKIALPNGLKKIGEIAFRNSAIKEATIPASVTEIENGGFEGVELTIKSRNVKLGQGLCNSKTPIHGYKGSTVEEYAKTNNCQFIEIPQSDILKGDMDQNEEIEIYDVMELLYIISEKKEKTDLAIEIGDMDDNGDLDIFDVMELLYIYTGKK